MNLFIIECRFNHKLQCPCCHQIVRQGSFSHHFFWTFLNCVLPSSLMSIIIYKSIVFIMPKQFTYIVSITWTSSGKLAATDTKEYKKEKIIHKGQTATFSWNGQRIRVTVPHFSWNGLKILLNCALAYVQSSTGKTYHLVENWQF